MQASTKPGTEAVVHRARCSRTAGPPSPLPADVGIRPRAPVAPMQSIGKRTHRQWCDRSGRPAAPHCRLAMTPPSLHSLSDAARSRRAHSGGPTRRSEIFSARLVGFSSSTHRSHQKPLHVLIGSPSTICEGGAVARTGSGGATRMQNARLACPHGRRRQQFSPASVQTALAAMGRRTRAVRRRRHVS